MRVINGDCLEVMRTLEASTFHAIVTDPPYHLTSQDKRDHRRASPEPSQRERHKGGFMNQAWDGGDVAFRVETWAEALRVAKPGAHLLAFGGTRTFHRLACAIEDAGWEIRDCLQWLYGSGFPKSLDVSKAIDKAAGAERIRGDEKVCPDGTPYTKCWTGDKGAKRGGIMGEPVPPNMDNAYHTKPATPEAEHWQGFGTALKPAYEPIILARKPLIGTVAENVLKHGCGALDIDGSRIGFGEESDSRVGTDAVRGEKRGLNSTTLYGGGTTKGGVQMYKSEGRWPSNVLLDQESAMLLDEQSGERPSGSMNGVYAGPSGKATIGDFNAAPRSIEANTGGASRFFYTSKAGQDERPEVDGVQHPTVKPLDLMRYLVGLVSREGDYVLDLFAGSGTTAEACEGLGRRWLVIEKNPDYIPLIEKRLKRVTPSLFAEGA